MGRRYAGSSSNGGPCRGLWRIGRPKAVKLFMWQACNDILPINENLFNREVLAKALCPICMSDAESMQRRIQGGLRVGFMPTLHT
jgi:hypothetical protein